MYKDRAPGPMPQSAEYKDDKHNVLKNLTKHSVDRILAPLEQADKSFAIEVILALPETCRKLLEDNDKLACFGDEIGQFSLYSCLPDCEFYDSGACCGRAGGLQACGVRNVLSN